MTRAALILLALASLTGCRTIGSDFEDLESKEYQDRKEAVISLAAWLREGEGIDPEQRARMLEAIRDALDDPSAMVRSVAVSSLASLEDRESADRIARRLEDRAWVVRFSALRALRSLEVKGYILPISEILRRDPNAHCRREAARTIGSFRSLDGFEACVAALSERETDESVRAAAWEALKQITGEDLPPRAPVWSAWRESHDAEAGTPPR